MKKYLFFYIITSLFLFANTTSPPKSKGLKADLVTVVKSQRKMYLSCKGKILKKYDIALGGNPVGHKRVRGDQKTPEGKYKLDYFKPNSSFYKALHISYPNRKDHQHARKLGKSPGGSIMIHGQPNNREIKKSFFQRYNDWTAGCIALENDEMDEVLHLVNVGTPIHIKP
ncbi:L,D-transpeptidase family protein [Sulfurovum sp. XTW-4]|uniref:L,D-transpeptidase family protein n=1 Tax=Sulfurovum xiamenensis TaxID=3019066 RepID=A0ABT7QU92_9BACT|nr:L,D-transpeptidase family protein [Sulfurovum xiamenensis]MDM5264661.1 L,D-transpeptidase family protein [Sulfurovum xiamenensis]